MFNAVSIFGLTQFVHKQTHGFSTGFSQASCVCPLQISTLSQAEFRIHADGWGGSEVEMHVDWLGSHSVL